MEKIESDTVDLLEYQEYWMLIGRYNPNGGWNAGPLRLTRVEAESGLNDQHFIEAKVVRIQVPR